MLFSGNSVSVAFVINSAKLKPRPGKLEISLKHTNFLETPIKSFRLKKSSLVTDDQTNEMSDNITS